MNTSRDRSKSFRLHHINKTGEFRKTSRSFIDPNDTFKLAAMNSVSKGVKLADLSMVTGRDLNKLRKEPLQPKNGEELSAHCSLMEVRVRYDEIKKKHMMAQLHIQQQKEEINKLQIFKKEYEDKQGVAKTKVDGLKEKLTDIKCLHEETSTELKVLQSLRSRHNADKVVYDQRKYDLEQELIHRRKQIDIYNKQHKDENQEQDRTTKVCDKLNCQLDEEQRQREMHIQNLEKMIEEKLALNNMNSHREAELSEIASRAIQDKMQTEKHWRKVQLTNVFVNRMLRDKINSEMAKFQTVEEAFKTIKTATGVSDSKTLVSKYLNKQAVYGQYLGKIADNERVINELKAEADLLVQETKVLEAEKEVLQSTRIKEQDLHDDIKQFEIQDSKALKSYFLNKKLNSWVERQFKKVSAISGAQEKAAQTFEEAVKAFLGRLATFLEQSDGQSVDEAFGSLGLAEKNTRVIPKRSRKNSAGEQIFDVEEQDMNIGVNHEQQDFINSQHDSLVQTNDKFMKHLRIKFEEERKLLIEKEQSKAKSPTKVPEPKKEED